MTRYTEEFSRIVLAPKQDVPLILILRPLRRRHCMEPQCFYDWLNSLDGDAVTASPDVGVRKEGIFDCALHPCPVIASGDFENMI
jgi:hypothetical protein